MSSIIVQGISKSFYRQKLFQDISFNLKLGQSMALLGNNGSGKSTLLSIIAGFMKADKGEIILGENAIISFSAPYMELDNDFTLEEVFLFHKDLQKIPKSLPINEFLDNALLRGLSQKKVFDLSSGMKQRLKLALQFNSTSNVWFIDEPCTNLDKTSVEWYQNNILASKDSKIIIVASNSEEEYYFCNQQLWLK